MITCKKIYREIPFANRQHHHTGSCSNIHGHNWTITIIFGCKNPDDHGFVIDFGGLHYIKNWIDKHLDHAFVINEEDPIKDLLLEHFTNCIKLYVVKDSTCEGLAKHFYAVFNAMVQEETKGRTQILSIEVAEDSKNSATYMP